MSRETDGTRASGRAKKPANVNGKRGHFMLQCMASGQSGNDHARNPPKTESLRVPVFWHHIPQTWVSFLLLLLIETLSLSSLGVKFVATVRHASEGKSILEERFDCPLTLE